MDLDDSGPMLDVGEYERFEALVYELSSRFLSVAPNDLDREIEDVQRSLCAALGVDLCGLWELEARGERCLTLTHFYSAQEDVLPLVPGMRGTEYFPWVEQEMLAGRSVAVSSMDELPEAAAFDGENARMFGLRSTLALPLTVGGGPPVGCLGFNTTRAGRRWPDALVKRLQLVAQIFANALARRRTDQALRESEEFCRATFDQAAVGIAHVATDGRCLRANDKLCAIVGYPREELLQLSFQDITHPDDLATDLDHVRRVLSGEIPTYSMEKRYLRKDGSLVWANLTVSLVRTADGQPRHFISVAEDITDRKRAEEALRISEARLAAAIELGGLGFVEVDEDTGTVFADDRLRELVGFPPDRELGMQLVAFWMEHVHPDDVPRVLGERQEALDGRREGLRVEYRYLHPARGETWIQHIGRPTTRDATGFAVKSFSVFRDITESKRAEEALRHSYVEIERLKDRLQAESDYLKAEIEVTQARGEVTGRSAPILKVLRSVDQVAATDSTVLVRGETGSGKELIAQAIHKLSRRRNHLMVKINCAALPAGLVESELFGREKGAFTGALARQVGRFEVADNSTLFLDEIGELSLEVQAKLLRVLEAGEFERLGSPRTIKVNVRLIAATNRDLGDAIKQGRFREDLYYRLNVFPIRVPPLRERPEDIPLLVWTFLEEFSSRMGKKITQVPRKTMELLQRHSWPGNVRELRNVVEHAAIITTGDTLRVPLLDDAAPLLTAAHTLADLEREYILRALNRAGWHVKGPNGAAADLGLNPGTLYGRMRKLGIPLHPPNGAAS
jgi:formate hydrogenlyase transcriptional activator